MAGRLLEGVGDDDAVDEVAHVDLASLPGEWLNDGRLVAEDVHLERLRATDANADGGLTDRRQVIERLQLVHSHEIEQLQLADLLIGAVAYLNRGLQGNAGKMAVIERMRQRSGYDLTRTTLLREEKMNIFRWHAAEVQE